METKKPKEQPTQSPGTVRLLLSGGGTGGHVYPILAVLGALPEVAASGRPSPATTTSAPAADTALSPPASAGPRDSSARSPAPDAPSPGAASTRPAADPARPGQALAASLAAANVQVLYVGTADGVEAELAQRSGLPFRAIESGQLRGMAPWTMARNLGKVARGARQAGRLLAEFRPQATFVTGGFVAAPVVWASWRAGVPVFIYLPDLEPGLAIDRLSRFATKVAVSFPETADHFPGKAVVTGYPVREEIRLAARDRLAARRQLGLDPDLPALLVFGGSRGARSINLALAAALPDLLAQCQVLHISGTLDWPEVEERALNLPAELRARYHPYPYLHGEQPLALAAADLAVARAGAATLGEFPAAGLPGVLVPYPHSGQFQDANADFMARRGAAVKLADEALSELLLPTLMDLLHEPARLAAMRKASAALDRPEAAADIARALLSLAVGTGKPA